MSLLTRDNIITRALGRCGNRSSDTDLTTHAQTEILLLQEELEAKPTLPWFLQWTFTGGSALTVTASVATVSTPTGFLREVEEDEGALWWNDTTVTPNEKVMLLKGDYATLVEKYRGGDDDTPQMYAITGTTITLFPTPDAAGTLDFRCYAAATTLGASGSTNVWTTYTSSLLVAGLAARLAGSYMMAYDIAQAQEAEFAKRYREMVVNEAARREAGYKRSMGDD